MPGSLHMPDATIETDRIITITDRAHEQILTLRAPRTMATVWAFGSRSPA